MKQHQQHFELVFSHARVTSVKSQPHQWRSGKAIQWLTLGPIKKSIRISNFRANWSKAIKAEGLPQVLGDAKEKLIFGFLEDTVLLFQVTHSRGNIVRSMKCEERKKLYGSIWADRWGGNFCGSFKWGFTSPLLLDPLSSQSPKSRSTQPHINH